jgi:hypothetical protein
MTELDIKIQETHDQIKELRSVSEEIGYEDWNGAQSAIADLQEELDELLKQKEIVDHLRH